MGTGNVIGFRFFFFWQWIHEEFLAYLDKWEKSVQERPGYTKTQKKRMMLSSETLLGLKITGTLQSCITQLFLPVDLHTFILKYTTPHISLYS